MKSGIKSHGILIVIVVLLLLVGSSTAYVAARSGEEAEVLLSPVAGTLGQQVNAVPIQGGPGFIMINPYAFQPATGGQNWNISYGGALNDLGTGVKYYGEALSLPHGATITKIVVYYTDNADGYLSIKLAEFDLDIGLFIPLATWVSEGKETGSRVMEVETSPVPTINNQSKSYFLILEFGGDRGIELNLRAVRIDYSYSANLPLVNR